MTDTSTVRENPYASQYRSFAEQTKDHELVVLHDARAIPLAAAAIAAGLTTATAPLARLVLDNTH